MMLKVDARGDACPLPVVKAKKAISELKGAGEVEVLVDNEIAVQNLTKMAQQKSYQYSAEKLAEREYRVLFTVGEASETPTEEAPACALDTRTDTGYLMRLTLGGYQDRQIIRTRAALYALDMLRRMALGLDVPDSVRFTPEMADRELDI